MRAQFLNLSYHICSKNKVEKSVKSLHVENSEIHFSSKNCHTKEVCISPQAFCKDFVIWLFLTLKNGSSKNESLMLVNTAFWSLLSSAILILFFFSYLFCLNFLNLDVAVDWEIISQLIIAAKAKADFIPILSYTSRSRGLKVEFRKAFIAMTCSICSKLRLPVRCTM